MTPATPLVIVAGGPSPAAVDGVDRVLAHVRAEQSGWLVLRYQLAGTGPVRALRQMRLGSSAHADVLERGRSDIWSAVTEDALRVVTEFGGRSEVAGIALHIGPVFDTQLLCWALTHLHVSGSSPGGAADLRGVVTVVDVGSWLDDATGRTRHPGVRGPAGSPERATLAHMTVADAEMADVVVGTGRPDLAVSERTTAALERLAPRSARLPVDRLDRRVLLERLPPTSRRGRPDGPGVPLLRGQPPLDAEHGVRLEVFTARRPCHLRRLRAAQDTRMTGIVRCRGRIWLAEWPDSAFWMAWAAGDTRLRPTADWLAAGGDEAWRRTDPDESAAAALRWHPRWGDRAQELLLLGEHRRLPAARSALEHALATDEEIRATRPGPAAQLTGGDEHRR